MALLKKEKRAECLHAIDAKRHRNRAEKHTEKFDALTVRVLIHIHDEATHRENRGEETTRFIHRGRRGAHNEPIVHHMCAAYAVEQEPLPYFRTPSAAIVGTSREAKAEAKKLEETPEPVEPHPRPNVRRPRKGVEIAADIRDAHMTTGGNDADAVSNRRITEAGGEGAAIDTGCCAIRSDANLEFGQRRVVERSGGVRRIQVRLIGKRKPEDRQSTCLVGIFDHGADRKRLLMRESAARADDSGGQHSVDFTLNRSAVGRSAWIIALRSVRRHEFRRVKGRRPAVSDAANQSVEVAVTVDVARAKRRAGNAFPAPSVTGLTVEVAEGFNTQMMKVGRDGNFPAPKELRVGVEKLRD